MRKYILILTCFMIAISAYTQKEGVTSSVLEQIKSNNTTIKALSEQATSYKVANRTGLNMVNPEVSYSRLWGNSNAEGNKYDFSISQSFDFPTAYRYKRQLADEQDNLTDLNLVRQEKDILHQARLLCINLIYKEKLREELSNRVLNAKQLYDAYERKFEAGDIDILERNKTKINLLNTEKALQNNEVGIIGLLAELQQMNGGIEVNWLYAPYPDYDLPLSFKEWYATIETNNPLILFNERQIVSSKKQEQLVKALNLPKITAGYQNSYEGGGRFNGFTIGLSIPLWEGKNTVKSRKAQTAALAMQDKDVKFQFYNDLKIFYLKATKLKILLNEYNETLNDTSNQDLLKKAFEKGQISLITYIQELSIYYETIDTYLQTEKDYYQYLADLIRWES